MRGPAQRRLSTTLLRLALFSLAMVLASCSINPIPTPARNDNAQGDHGAGGSTPANADVMTAGILSDAGETGGDDDVFVMSDVSAMDDSVSGADLIDTDANTNPCATDTDCDDDDPWTADRCSPEGCVHEGRPEQGFPCASDADCPGGDTCASRCDLGTGACVPDPEGALCGCASDADCDDNDPASPDVCWTGVLDDAPLYCCGLCRHEPEPERCPSLSDEARAHFETCRSAEDEDACVTAGGDWGIIGLGIEPSCSCPTGESACPCTRSTDCLASCIAPLPGGDIEGCAGVEGQCAGIYPTLGCWCFFGSDGEVMPVCAD